MGGPGFRLYHYTVDNVAMYLPRKTIDAATYRRGIYHQDARSVRAELLGQFDCPDSSLPAPRRVSTTSPLQAMSLLNNRFMIDQAQAFADRLDREVREQDRAAQVRRAYRLAFGRLPTAAESTAAVRLIEEHGLMVFCRALLNANEFIYVM